MDLFYQNQFNRSFGSNNLWLLSKKPEMFNIPTHKLTQNWYQLYWSGIKKIFLWFLCLITFNSFWIFLIFVSSMIWVSICFNVSPKTSANLSSRRLAATPTACKRFQYNTHSLIKQANVLWNQIKAPFQSIGKTSLSLTPDHDKEHPMELNFECTPEQIEFSRSQQHLTVPKSAKEILVRLKMQIPKTVPSVISWTHLVAVSKLRKLQKFEHSEMEIIVLSLEQGDWRLHWNMLQSTDKHLVHFQLQSFQGNHGQLQGKYHSI